MNTYYLKNEKSEHLGVVYAESYTFMRNLTITFYSKDKSIIAILPYSFLEELVMIQDPKYYILLVK
jgi:hypothetical protein